jgi:ER-bound oxygenase mpaB/B'/Rubber oxygenase, catalytic domain
VRATVNFFRHMGRLMGLKDIPETYEEFAGLLDGYERDHYAFNEPSRRVAEATIAIFQGWFPAVARPLARRGVLAMTDTPLREALGLPRAPRALEVAADRALRARALAVRLMPARPDRMPKVPRPRTYRNGYRLDDIGPGGTRERVTRTG